MKFSGAPFTDMLTLMNWTKQKITFLVTYRAVLLTEYADFDGILKDNLQSLLWLDGVSGGALTYYADFDGQLKDNPYRTRRFLSNSQGHPFKWLSDYVGCDEILKGILYRTRWSRWIFRTLAEHADVDGILKGVLCRIHWFWLISKGYPLQEKLILMKT